MVIFGFGIIIASILRRSSAANRIPRVGLLAVLSQRAREYPKERRISLRRTLCAKEALECERAINRAAGPAGARRTDEIGRQAGSGRQGGGNVEGS